ncbi:MAG TPA: DNA translocase FtsK 4TM domain-containing protein [Roseiarcus sp.]|nr:DNA translocase FtsK 4TM domain-containing protein [Roseiarcus sp.]
MRTTTFTLLDRLPDALREAPKRRIAEAAGVALLALVAGAGLSLMSWSVDDPSLTHATSHAAQNWLGQGGAITADLLMQFLGVGAAAALAPPAAWGWRLVAERRIGRISPRLLLLMAGAAATCGFASLLPAPASWPLPAGLGGVVGDAVLWIPRKLFSGAQVEMIGVGIALAATAILSLTASASYAFARPPAAGESVGDAPRRRAPPPIDIEDDDRDGEPGFALVSLGAAIHALYVVKGGLKRLLLRPRKPPKPTPPPRAPWLDETSPPFGAPLDAPLQLAPVVTPPTPPRAGSQAPLLNASQAPPVRAVAPPAPIVDIDLKPDQPSRVTPAVGPLKAAPKRAATPIERGEYGLPTLTMLAEPKKPTSKISDDALEQNARLLEGVLDDFGVKGEIINVRPGPVVTLYELEPAPGVKSSRVIGLADDIARSMSAISARVAVVQGRNAIGVELPNQRRETVFLREMLGSQDFGTSKHRLAIALGKTIGGEPVIVDLAKMPHLLVAGTTGSGKSVAINTFILSLLYRLEPKQCRLIMVDPKMLELSVYDGIPHLLTPVVTDPKKAVVALKWAVREMEDRYRKMSKVGVRNIDGFNQRVAEAAAKGEAITRQVQDGFDPETGELTYRLEEMALEELPYIVVVVDEMADLMMVAGKDIEGAIQRLAQMARAAGIHLIMATQRPSVDVITGTIKANFPTRISFQVTSKIDSRTILGEQGAEQLLGQGDMLYMAGGGRISRVHGPFVSDAEVEKIVAYLKTQGAPEYLTSITEEDAPAEEEEAAAPVAGAATMDQEEAGDYYDRAVAIVTREKKVSVSYIQRRLSVGYNKAASLVERMEKQGVVSAPNHQGKREVLTGSPDRDELGEE